MTSTLLTPWWKRRPAAAPGDGAGTEGSAAATRILDLHAAGIQRLLANNPDFRDQVLPRLAAATG
ncbi:hypothetical protein, partial [Streptomyces lavendulocolor]|uniref:hypothetical protein n=1 Tax=Streptomyces lavendulocolor TaxID=67316 RepID=UPI0033EE5530